MFTYKHKELEIIYRHTEYDDSLINGISIEILDIIGSEYLNKLIFSKFIKKFEFKFILFKISPFDLGLKKKLWEIGFYYVTSTVQLYELNLQDKNYIDSEDLFIDFENRENSFSVVKNLMLDNFGHGKFYEDFNLSDLSLKRQDVVLNNLYIDKLNEFVVIKNNLDIPLGYFIHKKGIKFQELLFAGLNVNYLEVGLGVNIWNKFHAFLKLRSVYKTHTSISLSNIGVLNIYSKLNYAFKNIKEHYHFYV